MPSLSHLDRLARALRNANSSGPVPTDRIVAAEHALGVTFPQSYRAFLSVFGASIGNGYEFAGLPEPGEPEQTPMWTDVIQTTLQNRRVSRGNATSALIPVSSDGCYYTFYLDTSRKDATAESPVVVLGPGRDYEIVAPSFVDFVEQLTSNAPSA